MDIVMILMDVIILMVSGVVEVVRTDTTTITMLRNVLEYESDVGIIMVMLK